MSLSNNFPTIFPELNLDFANTGVLDPRITFTRASTATYFNQLGVLTSAAVDVPRFDYNPSTLAPLGLLVEEARTNSIRNNTMQGAVAGTPGTLPTNWSTFTSLTGITRQIVGTGTENGITYIDVRLSGTPSAAGLYGIYFEQATQIAALSGQIWTATCYAKLAAGSTSGVTEIRNSIAELNSSSGFLAGSNTSFTPTSAALSTQRFSVTRTLNQATTAFVLSYFDVVLSGVAIDITLRIGLPQLELGSFATSVIPTTTTALTRSADVASMTGTNFSSWYNAAEGTFVVSSTQAVTGTAGALCALEAGDGTNNNVIQLGTQFGTTNFQGLVNTSGVAQAVFLSSASTALTNRALAYKVNDFAQSINGGAVSTDTSGTVPTVTSFGIGARPNGTSQLNGYLRRLAYYSVRLTNAQLQALTL